jgi:hypothetical protein
LNRQGAKNAKILKRDTCVNRVSFVLGTKGWKRAERIFPLENFCIPWRSWRLGGSISVFENL